MKRLRWLTVLMGITLVIITGFQVYWLKDNYNREKRTLQIKTGVAFQDAIRQLQSAKLKLPDQFMNDSLHKGRPRIFFDGDDDDALKRPQPRREIITMVNTLRTSVKKDTSVKSTIVITGGNGDALKLRKTSFIKFKNGSDSNHVYNFLYKIDSLQDSLRLPEIIKAYSSALKKENIAIQFSITKSAGFFPGDDAELSDVTVGFANPLTYHLSLLNTTSYIVKKLTLPILFSFFLVGVTLLSFILLYKSLLRQQRLADIKNEFISNITHELKTPIATVSVAIEALKNFNAMHDPQKTKEYLDISSNELQRLGLLVDKVLKLSMFEKKQIELNKESFNMKGLLQEVLDTMKLQFEKNNAVVNFTTVGKDFIITADKLHITSVIYNLLDNALKYSIEKPFINVQLSAQQNNIELRVSDNGIGIPHEYQSRIFDKFFRVPTGNKHFVKGYGLGLSYVSHIVAQHNGTIKVESEVNKGSTFIITIPTMHGEG